MSSDKKDLTRIEDLGEYLHELSEDEPPSFEEETPALPENDESGSFESSFDSEPAFASSEEDSPPPVEETPDFGSADFGGETDFGDSDSFPTSADTFEVTEEDNLFSSPTEEPEPEQSFQDEPQPETLAHFEDPAPEPAPVQEIIPEFSNEPPKEHAYKAPETFSDVKQFAEVSSFAGMGAEGNPSFSVLIRNVRFIEDVNDIMILLKELDLLSDSEETMKGRLMRGTLLIPRISEFAAVFLAHKLRRFDIDLQVGLSDEIHPPKHGESPETGIVSKHNLYQNQSHHFHFDDERLELSQIVVAATPNLEGHQVVKYLGVASEHKLVDAAQALDEDADELPRYYHELAQKLKAHALKARANAVVGLNYQLTPLPGEYGMAGPKFRLSCTGNLVWVNKL